MPIQKLLLTLILAIGSFSASADSVNSLIDRAGNSPSDVARLMVLQDLIDHPALSDIQRQEAQQFTEIVSRYTKDADLLFFNREVLKTEDYNFAVSLESPLYPLTHLYRARMIIWVTMEHGGLWKKPEVRRARYDMIRAHFEAAHKAFPEEPLARMYLGESLAPTKLYNSPVNTPTWAKAQRECLERLSDIIHWWIDHRLQENGQYGGGWGDDCEMWRWWTPILIGFEDEKIQEAQSRFSTALLNQKHMKCGYTEHAYDVEHTSEDSSDAITPMLHLMPDSVEWQARALRLVELSQTLWMGRNDRDQLQFKSTYFSVDKVNDKPEFACDTVYHPRVFQPALLLWQRTHDAALTKHFTDWMRTWVDAAARTERGKPAGVIPSAIHWPEGTVGGIGENWWNPENHSSDPLYRFPSAMGLMTHSLLLSYHVTGDETFLSPLRSMAALRLEYLQNPPKLDPPLGSASWCASRMGSLSSVLSKYQLLTKSNEFDALLQSGVSPYVSYRFGGDETSLVDALAQTATALSINYPGYTSEVRFTDRVLRLPRLFASNGMYPDAIPGFTVPDTALLYATVTGDPGMAGYFPLNAVRWLTPARDIAAFVTESGTNSFEAKLFHFGAAPRNMGAELYLLATGRYKMEVGVETSYFMVKGPRTRIDFTLPAQQEIHLRIITDKS